MLITKEELRNLERFAQAETAMYSVPLQESMTFAFEESSRGNARPSRKTRRNPSIDADLGKALSEIQQLTGLTPSDMGGAPEMEVIRDFVCDAHTTFDEYYDVQMRDEVESDYPDFDISRYAPLVRELIVRATLFGKAFRVRRAPSKELSFEPSKRLKGYFGQNRERGGGIGENQTALKNLFAYGHFAHKRVDTLSALFLVLQDPSVKRAIESNKAYECGVYFILLQLMSSEQGFLDVDRFDGRPLWNTILISADYFQNFESLDEVAAFFEDSTKEKERASVNTTLRVIHLYARGEAYLKWKVAAGFSTFKRLSPMLKPLLRELTYADSAYISNLNHEFDHFRCAYLLQHLALARMPAKQLKGYSKKIATALNDAMLYGDMHEINVVQVAVDNALMIEIEGFVNERMLQSNSVMIMLITKLINTVSGGAGEYISHATALYQKANGRFDFDTELIAGLCDADAVFVEEAVRVSDSFALQVSMAAALLSALPQSEYEKITNLDKRSFEYIQDTLIAYLANQVSLKSESIINLYLDMEGEPEDYFEWSIALLKSYIEADGHLGEIDFYPVDEWRSFLKKDKELEQDGFIDQSMAWLQTFVEGKENALTDRDFTASLMLGYSEFMVGPDDEFKTLDIVFSKEGLVSQIAGAALYRQIYGFEVKPKLHRLEGNLVLAELSAFHPLWWIIGSKSVADCCMVPRNAGFSSSRSGFWGERDKSFILYAEDTQTILGSIQCIGVREWRSANPWMLAFDGYEARSSSARGSNAQKRTLKKYTKAVVTREMPAVKQWLAENVPVMFFFEGGYSNPIDFSLEMDVGQGLSLLPPEYALEISDSSQAYRDFVTDDVPKIVSRATALTLNLKPAGEVPSESVTSNLEGYNFAGMFAQGFDFTDMTFKNVNLAGADLRDAVFEGVTFSFGVDLEGALLSGAEFNNSSVESRSPFTLKLEDVTVDEETLRNFVDNGVVTLQDLTFDNGLSLSDTDFSGEDLSGQIFNKNVFAHCDFQDAKFTQAKLDNVNFRECSFTDTDFSKSQLTGCEFDAGEPSTEGMLFAGAELYNCDFNHELEDVSFAGAEINECYFTSLQNVSFVGITSTPPDRLTPKAIEVGISSSVSNVSFEGANAGRIKFRSSTVHDVTFRDARISASVDFLNCKLVGLIFDGASIAHGIEIKIASGEHVRDISFIKMATPLDLSFSIYYGTIEMYSARFDNTELSDACSFDNVSFLDCSFDGTIFNRGVSVIDSEFVNCSFDGAVFSPGFTFTKLESGGRGLYGSDFEGAVLQGVDFDELSVEDCSFSGANLQGADLSRVEDFSKVSDMTGAIFDENTKIPNGLTVDELEELGIVFVNSRGQLRLLN